MDRPSQSQFESLAAALDADAAEIERMYDEQCTGDDSALPESDRRDRERILPTLEVSFGQQAWLDGVVPVFVLGPGVGAETAAIAMRDKVLSAGTAQEDQLWLTQGS